MKEMLKKETLPFWGSGTNTRDYPTIREARDASVPKDKIDFVLWNWGIIVELPEGWGNKERALNDKGAYESLLGYIRDMFVRI